MTLEKYECIGSKPISRRARFANSSLSRITKGGTLHPKVIKMLISFLETLKGLSSTETEIGRRREKRRNGEED